MAGTEESRPLLCCIVEDTIVNSVEIGRSPECLCVVDMTMEMTRSSLGEAWGNVQAFS